MEEKKARVGIIGCGGIANGKHLPSLKQLENVEIVAFCDLIKERAVKAATEYGDEKSKVYINYKELLQDNSIDVVHVLTPNKSHTEITINALNAGKHVFCEKPIAINYTNAKLMLDAAEKAGKLLSVGYQKRYRADSIYLKRAVEAGEFGDIYYAKAHSIRRRAVPTWGVFINEEEQGGGALIDIGTHALDLTLWLLDNYEPKTVVGNVYHKLNKTTNQGNIWGNWDPDKFTAEDSAFGFITMKNGATIIVESSWALNTFDVFEACTSFSGTKAGADTRGSLRINKIEYNTQIDISPNCHVEGVDFFKGVNVSPEVLEQQTFYNAVLHHQELVVKPEQALVVTQILDAIYESSKSNKLISFY